MWFYKMCNLALQNKYIEKRTNHIDMKNLK